MTVTLVTGDEVTVYPGGMTSVEPGPGRGDVTFDQQDEGQPIQVVPSDAASLLMTGRLDERLFDISYLIEEGYDDSHRQRLPLLVEGRAAAVRDVASGPGAAITGRLPLTGFTAVVQGRRDAVQTDLWSRLTAAAASQHSTAAEAAEPGLLPDGVERVWLDGKVHATLEDSVPQIGAPQVWDAGYTGEGVTVAVLDTGVDARHPDLAGQVTDQRVFSESPRTGQFIVEQVEAPLPYLDVVGALPTPRQGVSDPLVEVGRACTASGGDELTADPAGKTALVVRGLCPFAEKYDAVIDAGATGVVFYNDVAGMLRATVAGAAHEGQVWAAGLANLDGTALADLLEAGESVALGFSDQLFIGDLFGHGTHVAATIAGTGAGSDGARTGVAPDATIMNGKVLNDDGSGQSSWVIAGMEWAATNGADVINMSLGGGPTDGTDPQAQAVNRLTAEHDVLFVISAGNSYGYSTVGTPGSADDALTVGAVDKNDELADFSSRGPRRGDFAVKPNVTAPGVDIVAARAARTAMGTPVDDSYTTASGTSMAAPHVAGAAALLAQARPNLDALALKDALASTAIDGGRLWYEQGTGRIDVARAVTQGVYADASVDLGDLTGTDQPVEKPVTYSNQTDRPVVLALEASVTDETGEPVAGLRLSSRSVRVPANGHATVTVTLDPAAANKTGAFGGVITATARDATLRTAIGFGGRRTFPPITPDWHADWVSEDPYPAAGGSATLSPDGSQLVFSARRRLDLAAGSDAGEQQYPKVELATAVVDADTGEEIWAVSEPVGEWSAREGSSVAVAPDSSQVFVSHNAWNPELEQVEQVLTAYNNTPPNQPGDPELGEQLWRTRRAVSNPDVQLPWPSIAELGTYQISVSPDGSTVIVLGNQQTQRLVWQTVTIAYDAATGEQKWIAPYEDAAESRATDLVLSPSGDLAYVTAYAEPTQSDPHPVTVAYAVSGDRAGEQAWVARNESLPWRNTSGWHNALSEDGERLFVSGGVNVSDETGIFQDYRMVTWAYDAATGEQLWESPQFGAPDDVGWAVGIRRPNSIAVDPAGELVIVTGGLCEHTNCTGDFALVTVAYDQATGQERWRHVDGIPASPVQPPLGGSAVVSPDGDQVYVTGICCGLPPFSGDGILSAYDTGTGERLAVAREPIDSNYREDGRVLINSEGTIYTVTTVSGGGVVAAYSPPILLAAEAHRVSGDWAVDLTWSGAGADEVDVYRDGELVATVVNTGSHTDRLGKPPRGSEFAYKVCAVGTTTCSKEVTVVIGARAARPSGSKLD